MFGRRDFMRIDTYLDMTLNPGKVISHNYVIGVTINFCREGFSFVSENFKFTSNGPMEFRIKLPHKDKYASASGDITWKTQVRDRCLAGVKIRQMDEEMKREVLDYSYNTWIEGVRFH